MGVFFGPLYFDDNPILDICIDAAVREGVADGTDSFSDLNAALLIRNLPLEYAYWRQYGFDGHNGTIPFPGKPHMTLFQRRQGA